jgi:ribose transport system permease protein
MKALKQTQKKKVPAFLGPLIAVLLLSIVLTIASEQFLTINNWMNIFRQTAISALVALGMLMVLLTGGIDLSVGPMVALSSCVMGVMLKAGIDNSFILISSCLLVGLAAGVLNGLLFTRLDLPHPFVSTMGTRMMFRGLALLITGSAPIAGFPMGVSFLGSSSIAGFPIAFLVDILFFAIIGLFLNKVALGRKIYSVGGNKEAARLSGINVKDTLTFPYIMSGFMCAVAGIVLVGRVGTAFPLAGETYDMDAIAACVIGGASFFGGKGTVSGTLIGVLLISIIRNGLNLLGAKSDMQYIVIGAVIIGAVFLDVVRTKAGERTRRLAQAKVMAEEESMASM